MCTRSRSPRRRSAAAPTCQELPQVPLQVCWNILGHRRAAWAVRDEELSWDRFGFCVEEDVWVVMDAFRAGEREIALVDYPHGLHLGPHAVVQLDFHGEKVDNLLHELCTTRAVRHWVSRWRRAVHRRRGAASASSLATPSGQAGDQAGAEDRQASTYRASASAGGSEALATVLCGASTG